MIIVQQPTTVFVQYIARDDAGNTATHTTVYVVRNASATGNRLVIAQASPMMVAINSQPDAPAAVYLGPGDDGIFPAPLLDSNFSNVPFGIVGDYTVEYTAGQVTALLQVQVVDTKPPVRLCTWLVADAFCPSLHSMLFWLSFCIPRCCGC